MKVYSWNVKFDNRSLADVFDFIEKLEFDVLCLQEVPLTLLERLKTLPVGLVFTTDARNAGGVHIYNLILSRIPILKSENFEIPLPTLPLRAKIFITIMYPYGWSTLLEKRSLYIDVQLSSKTVRIFSFHATLFGPRNRFKELDQVIQRIDADKSTIIAGDFNVINLAPLKILSWLLGSPFTQAVPWYSERDEIEKIFETNNLQNPFRGRITHKFSQSQLDHIIVSKELRIKDSWVEKNSHGSDHQPIGLEAEF